MPLPILIELQPSPSLLVAAMTLLVGALCALLWMPLAPWLRIAALAPLLVVGVVAVNGLRYGRAGRALSRLEWLGGPHWVLANGEGRVKAARLASSSRRLGRVSFLIFERGVFGRFDRPWVVIRANMVSDGTAARRLRARLTLDTALMHGLDVP